MKVQISLSEQSSDYRRMAPSSIAQAYRLFMQDRGAPERLSAMTNPNVAESNYVKIIKDLYRFLTEHDFDCKVYEAHGYRGSVRQPMSDDLRDLFRKGPESEARRNVTHAVILHNQMIIDPCHCRLGPGYVGKDSYPKNEFFNKWNSWLEVSDIMKMKPHVVKEMMARLQKGLPLGNPAVAGVREMVAICAAKEVPTRKYTWFTYNGSKGVSLGKGKSQVMLRRGMLYAAVQVSRSKDQYVVQDGDRQCVVLVDLAASDRILERSSQYKGKKPRLSSTQNQNKARQTKAANVPKLGASARPKAKQKPKAKQNRVAVEVPQHPDAEPDDRDVSLTDIPELEYDHGFEHEFLDRIQSLSAVTDEERAMILTVRPDHYDRYVYNGRRAMVLKQTKGLAFPNKTGKHRVEPNELRLAPGDDFWYVVIGDREFVVKGSAMVEVDDKTFDKISAASKAVPLRTQIKESRAALKDVERKFAPAHSQKWYRDMFKTMRPGMERTLRSAVKYIVKNRADASELKIVPVNKDAGTAVGFETEVVIGPDRFADLGFELVNAGTYMYIRAYLRVDRATKLSDVDRDVGKPIVTEMKRVLNVILKRTEERYGVTAERPPTFNRALFAAGKESGVSINYSSKVM